MVVSHSCTSATRGEPGSVIGETVRETSNAKRVGKRCDLSQADSYAPLCLPLPPVREYFAPCLFLPKPTARRMYRSTVAPM